MARQKARGKRQEGRDFQGFYILLHTLVFSSRLTYIATDNQVVADRILDQIEEKCQMLAKNPGIGQARPDIAPEMRYFPVGSYLILYREIKDGIEVVRVVHGARHLPDILT